MHSRLAIHYGAATVRAVLVAPGGTNTLRLDGAGEMSTAVHVSGNQMTTGAAAWRLAATHPDGLVASPLRAGTGHITVGGTEVEVVEVVAATLRQIAAEAQRTAGEPVDDVRLVVPAEWGPRRRTWLRHAARTAGLAVTRVVEAPVAALTLLDPRDAAGPLAPDRPALILDVGAGCEVSVVQPGPAGAEVLSTLNDPDVGGDRIDATLFQTLTGAGVDEVSAQHRWMMLTNIRTARHALTEQVAVTMAMPDGQPPMVVNAVQVTDAARPVFEHVGELAAQALGNADLTLDEISGVYLIGGAAVTPGAVEMIAAKLGATAQPAHLPHLAAVLGAADATSPDTANSDDATADALRWPPLRRLLTLALPGVASLALYAHFVLSADSHNGTPTDPRYGYYVLALWGQLAVAGVLALITFLQGAALFAALLDQHTTTGTKPAGSRISGGIGLATAAGLATASLYGISAAVLFAYPISGVLRWSLLPSLPVAAATATVAVLAWRRRATPAGGWDHFLTFPASSMILATAGILAVGLWWHVGMPWWLNGWDSSIGLTGGLLVGIAIAFTLVRHPVARLALIIPIGFFTMILSRKGPGIPAVMWAIAVACWWGWHAWALIRTPPTSPARR